MIKYRVDQVVNGKFYEGGRTFNRRETAVMVAAQQAEADKVTGDCQITYIVTPIKVK